VLKGWIGHEILAAREITPNVKITQLKRENLRWSTGRYSNLCDQGERIQDLLRIVPEGSPEVNLRTPKQVQHRLSPNEIDNLVRLYRTGARVDELAAHFYIHRNTVSEILNRQGVPRRRQGIPSELLSEVVSAYVAGSSLAVLGSQLSVDPATVSRTLRHAGYHFARDLGGTTPRSR